MYSRYHYLSDTGPNFFNGSLGIWTTTNFQNQVWIETLGTILYVINTVSDGYAVKSYFLISIRLDWCEIQYKKNYK